MKRAIVLALGVILALALAAPIAVGQQTSEGQQGRGNLAAAWWNWVASKSPSPLEGSYTGGAQCEGEFVDGVFFLAGNTGGTSERTCTVPADTPIFFPVFNGICSEVYGVAGQNPPDPQPYTKCVQAFVSDGLADSEWFATLDGEDLHVRRMASGLFDWNIQYSSSALVAVLPDGSRVPLPVGTWESASDGLWVYLPQGLDPGEYTLHFGGSFYGGGFSLDVTYHLIVV